MTITHKLLRPTLVGLCLMILTALVACSGSETGSDTVLGPESAAPSFDSGSGSDGSGGGDSSGPGSGDEVRVEARLNPIINVDASGHARSRDRAGRNDDRFDSEVEIAQSAFARLGIDAADGFNDEVVVISVTRGGNQIFSQQMRFTGTQGVDIIFERDIRGRNAPQFRAGDVGRVSVNGNDTLRGTFERE
jgi:hypothetical protein